jgi:hypothetical protein
MRSEIQKTICRLFGASGIKIDNKIEEKKQFSAILPIHFRDEYKGMGTNCDTGIFSVNLVTFDRIKTTKHEKSPISKPKKEEVCSI